MIINGWLDWAIKLPAPLTKTYSGTNQAKGIFLHSAEGYKSTLLDLAIHGPYSWHFSNCMDGTFYQHYPITSRCWHATAANFSYLGMENEGIGDPKYGSPNPTLNEPQINNAVRAIRDISLHEGWTPSRPDGLEDWQISYTLWEHNEVTKLGGTYSQCPSGRIPWQTILEGLKMPTDQDQINALLALAHFIRNQWNLNDLSDFDIKAIEIAVERMRQANAN